MEKPIDNCEFKPIGWHCDNCDRNIYNYFRSGYWDCDQCFKDIYNNWIAQGSREKGKYGGIKLGHYLYSDQEKLGSDSIYNELCRQHYDIVGEMDKCLGLNPEIIKKFNQLKIKNDEIDAKLIEIEQSYEIKVNHSIMVII